MGVPPAQPSPSSTPFSEACAGPFPAWSSRTSFRESRWFGLMRWPWCCGSGPRPRRTTGTDPAGRRAAAHRPPASSTLSPAQLRRTTARCPRRSPGSETQAAVARRAHRWTRPRGSRTAARPDPGCARRDRSQLRLGHPRSSRPSVHRQPAGPASHRAGDLRWSRKGRPFRTLAEQSRACSRPDRRTRRPRPASAARVRRADIAFATQSQ